MTIQHLDILAEQLEILKQHEEYRNSLLQAIESAKAMDKKDRSPFLIADLKLALDRLDNPYGISGVIGQSSDSWDW